MQHPDVLADYHERFNYLLVDEYQDTNVAQYLWLRLLASDAPERLLRGRRRPVDLRLARGRGGQHPALRARLPGAKVIRLERNYRSTEPHPGRRLGPDRRQQGPAGQDAVDRGARAARRSGVRGVWDGEAESRLIADEIERAQGRTSRPRSTATSPSWSAPRFQMRAFEERFVLLQIPYTVVGGPRFFERAEIRDAHAYLRLIQSPDDDLAFERIVNVPKRGIGDTTVQKLLQIARGARRLGDAAAARGLVADRRAGRPAPARRCPTSCATSTAGAAMATDPAPRPR